MDELSALSITGVKNAMMGRPAYYTVSVKNLGANTQTNYDVHLKHENGTIIQTLPGVEIALNETKQFQFTWTPQAEGTFKIYGEVDLPGDQIPNNDKTLLYEVSVFEGNFTIPYTMSFEDDELWQLWNNVGGRAIGEWERHTNDLNAKDGISYMVYNSSAIEANAWLFSPELPLQGNKAYRISFWVRNEYDLSGFSQKLALYLASSNTPQSVIGSPLWINESISSDIYTKYEGTVAGLDGMYNFGFHIFSDNNMGRMFLDYFQVEEMGSVIGNVTDDYAIPLEGVLVEIVGTNNKSYSNASGNFVLGIDQLGSYSFKASKIGYISSTKTVNITAFGQYVNFLLNPVNVYNVSGKVTGNDTNGVGIEGVHITLSGETNYEIDTDPSGNYSISGVYDLDTYNLKATKAGYTIYTNTFTMSGAHVTKNITLEEILYPVGSISVSEVNAANPNAVITWEAPNTDKEGTRSLTGYNVYRSIQGAEWMQIETNINALTCTDLNAWSLPYGIYRYAVKAVYTSGLSNEVQSNNVNIRMTVPFIVNITTNDSQPVTGATVKLTNVNPTNPSYTKESEANGITFNEVWRDHYNLTVIFEGYQPYTFENIDITQDNTPAHKVNLTEYLLPVPDGVLAEPNEAMTLVKISWEAPSDSRFCTGYDVYRKIVGSSAAGTKIADNTNALFCNDAGSNLASGTNYYWEVIAIYSGDLESPKKSSNVLQWGMLSSVSFELTTNGNAPINGAIATLKNQDEDESHVYSKVVTESPVIIRGVFKGIYTLTVEMGGYQTYTNTMVLAVDDFVTLNPVVLVEIKENPFNLSVTEIETCEHKFKWNTPTDVNITVTTSDVFGEGIGFQMWLDNTAAHYGSTYLPISGNFGTCTSLNPTIINQFSHKIPQDCSISCSNTPASNWIMNRSVTTQIPVGIYDFGFIYLRFGTLNVTNSTYNDCNDGIKNNFEFEGGKKYTFSCTTPDMADFCLTVENDDKNENSKLLLGYNVYLNGIFVAKTNDRSYTFTDVPAGNNVAGVQSVYSSGVSEIVTVSFVSTCAATLPTYTIGVSSSNGALGSVTGGNTYTKYQKVTLTATPTSGNEFLNWTENGNAVSIDNPFEFAAMANRSLVGNFRGIPVTYTITATANNNAWGTVTGAGTGTFEHNESVTLTATPKDGCEFVNWTENGNVLQVPNPYTFNATANRNIVGNFRIIPEFTISVTSNNDDWGTVSGGGNFGEFASVSLGATALQGCEFVNWTENNLEVSKDNPYKFQATENRTIRGNFKKITFTITVNPNNSDWGSVTGGGDYETGASVSIKADAKPGYHFEEWQQNGVTLSKDNPYSFVALENTTIIGVFASNGAIKDNNLVNVTLTPNPFKNEINISNPEIVKNIQIMNITGHKVKEVIFDGKTISTEELATGIYFVTVESLSGEKVVFKMVKK